MNELNAKLGASLWTAIHYYEVVLRNLVDKALSQSFSENWVENAAFLSMIKQQKCAAIETVVKYCTNEMVRLIKMM